MASAHSLCDGLSQFPPRWQVRELTDAEFPHSFLVSGKQRTLELQARWASGWGRWAGGNWAAALGPWAHFPSHRSQEEMISWMQVWDTLGF
jgi:hypothetical protein